MSGFWSRDLRVQSPPKTRNLGSTVWGLRFGVQGLGVSDVGGWGLGQRRAGGPALAKDGKVGLLQETLRASSEGS